eukprot:UN34918
MINNTYMSTGNNSYMTTGRGSYLSTKGSYLDEGYINTGQTGSGLHHLPRLKSLKQHNLSRTRRTSTLSEYTGSVRNSLDKVSGYYSNFSVPLNSKKDKQVLRTNKNLNAKRKNMKVDKVNLTNISVKDITNLKPIGRGSFGQVF